VTATVRQGQIWQAKSPIVGQHATVVVLDATPGMLERRRILAARVRPEREVPQAMRLLAVPISVGDVVAVYDIAAFDQAWLVEQAGALSADELGRVKNALSARFDL
jgi:hypothetical protein